MPVFTDVVNAFAEKYPDTTLFSGHIEKGGKSLHGHVRHVKASPYNRKNSFTRSLSWFLFTVHYFVFLCLCRKPDKILVVTNPPTAPLVTALVARIRKIPFYILIFDLYPDALAQAGFVENKSYLFRVWKKVNPWPFSTAEKVFTLSDSMKAAVLQYMPGKAEKIRVIHNWADVSYIHPIPRSENAFLKKYGLFEKKLILYSGNMGLTHDLESLISAAEILASEMNYCFVFIGDGGKRKLLEQMTVSKKLNNVIFLPYQDSAAFPHAMAAADIGVVTLGKGAEGISVPSKTYINMAAGLCLLAIAPATSELSRLVKTHQAGCICEPGDPVAIADTINRILSDDALLENYKRNALQASSHYTSENAVQYVDEVMD